jgi:hypothetical protein
LSGWATGIPAPTVRSGWTNFLRLSVWEKARAAGGVDNHLHGTARLIPAIALSFRNSRLVTMFHSS